MIGSQTKLNIDEFVYLSEEPSAWYEANSYQQLEIISEEIKDLQDDQFNFESDNDQPTRNMNTLPTPRDYRPN